MDSTPSEQRQQQAMIGRKLSTSTDSTCSSSLDQSSSSRRSKTKKERKLINRSEMRNSLQAATMLLTASKTTNGAVEHQQQQPTINCDGLRCKINRSGGEHDQQQSGLNNTSEMRSSLQAAALLITTKKSNNASTTSKEHYQKPGVGLKCKINRPGDNNASMSDLIGVESSSSSVTVGSDTELLLEEQAEYLRYAKTHSINASTTSSSNKSHTEPLPETTTITPASTHPVPRTKKSVSFSTVSVRHYKRIMTVNPATNRGVSIGIGWNYIQRHTEPVDRYQERRAPLLRPCLLLSQVERDELLLGLGYTRPEIAATLRCINGFRNQRRQTVTNLPAEKMEEAFQGAGRRVKRLLGFERRLMKPEEQQEPILDAECELCPNSYS